MNRKMKIAKMDLSKIMTLKSILMKTIKAASRAARLFQSHLFKLLSILTKLSECLLHLSNQSRTTLVSYQKLNPRRF